MKKSKYNDAQAMSILTQAENGARPADLCREHDMGSTIFYRWRAKYPTFTALGRNFCLRLLETGLLQKCNK